ncbi:ergosterol biosynthesis ERG4/ERG24 family-domain-containing protein [Pisolithus croceorrhizus]|nr:ergosterol biosynthesis ERG4/ERG24 family-domain-containing protein [Pisolithus croceorrhizus]
MAGSSSDLRQRKAVGDNAKPVTTTDEGRKSDKLLDEHHGYEFGGPWGVTAMMVGFPILMYYLWICLWFYDGKLVAPSSVDDIIPFLQRMWTHVRESIRGLIIYQLFLAWVMPGYQQEALHYYHIFRLTEIINNYGHLMSVAMIYGFAVSFGVYFLTVATGNQIRMSGNFIYDVFMGACLNPRIGPVDLKMWAEVRIPWVIVFFLAVSGGCHQYEQYGYVTPNMAFMILATWLYLNACGKGEECIPQTWDMYHEKWGFMVIFWNFAGVPFTSTAFPPPTYVLLFTVLLTCVLHVSAVFDWDTSMSQKSRFKMQTQGITTFRKTNRLLISGWWKYSRKPNYVADWVMSFCWGVIIGRATAIPYFYSVFFITVLIHRCGRDFERCSVKYGKDWERYCEIVKYKFIPGVY